MQLVYFLFLPSALISNQLLHFAADGATPSLVESGAIDWHACLNMWLVVGCFALAARWLEKAQRQCFDGSMANKALSDQAQTVWMLRNRESLLLWLWCLLQPICLVASGWTQWTSRMNTAIGSQSMSIALSLTPCIVLLLLIELIRVSRMNRFGQIATSIYTMMVSYRVEVTRTILNTWFIPVVLPIAIAALVDLATKVQIVGPNPGLFGTIACTLSTSAIVTLLLPYLFTKLIGAGPVDETVLNAVESTWRIGSSRVPRILLWPTGCRVANAAVVGLFGFGRKLLLTDALIQKLNERELAMVVLHELSHCVRFHAWIRMAPTLVIVVLLLGSMTFITGVWLSVSCVLLFLLFLASLIAVCWWTEFDADRVAILMAAHSSGKSARESHIRVHATELCEALRKIYGEKNLRRRSWMHPSCRQRLKAIQSLVMRSASRNGDSFEPLRCDC